MTLISKFRLTAAIGAALLSTAAMANQALIPTQSNIDFTAKQLGVPISGHFKKFTAQVQFNPAQLDSSKIHFTVDMGSATMGSQETDSNLLSADWFNAPQFPQATFNSSSIRALGNGQFQVDGALSIKGQSQPVSVPVQLTQSGDTTTATGSFTVQRLPFKIGDGDWADTSIVANDVSVQFKLALTGINSL